MDLQNAICLRKALACPFPLPPPRTFLILIAPGFPPSRWCCLPWPPWPSGATPTPKATCCACKPMSAYWRRLCNACPRWRLSSRPTTLRIWCKVCCSMTSAPWRCPSGFCSNPGALARRNAAPCKAIPCAATRRWCGPRKPAAPLIRGWTWPKSSPCHTTSTGTATATRSSWLVRPSPCARASWP